MKQLLLIGSLLLSTVLYSQTEKIAIPKEIPTNVQRYKVDFEIENFQITSAYDSLLINDINLDLYEESRNMTQDVQIEINMNNSSYILIMYSVEKSGLKKGNYIQQNSNEKQL